MEILEIIIGLLLVAAAGVLVAVVLFQEAKSDRLSGAVAGAGGDTYWSKGKGKSQDKLKERITLIVSICFVVVVLALYILQPWKARINHGDFENIKDYTGSVTTTAAPTTTVTPSTTGAATTTVAPVTTTAPVTTVAP
jgi:preprotein translocase subunit SecG